LVGQCEEWLLSGSAIAEERAETGRKVTDAAVAAGTGFRDLSGNSGITLRKL
jgi:hypothetical protein